MLLNIFDKFIHNLTNWGISQLFSIIFTFIIIGISLPFTYVGYSIRRVIEYKIKRFQGFAIRKYTTHAVVCVIFLLSLEIILYFTLNQSKFFSISFIFSLMVIIGLMGVKLTFSLEEMIDNWIGGLFDKKNDQ
jgi:hypothetical protein